VRQVNCPITSTFEDTVLGKAILQTPQLDPRIARTRLPGLVLRATSLLALALISVPALHASGPADSATALPDAPDGPIASQTPGAATTTTPTPAATLSSKTNKKPLDACDVQNTGATVINTAAVRALAVSGLHAAPTSAGESAVGTEVCANHLSMINWYARFTTGPDVKPMTVSEKARLAVVNVMDPFNFLTIFGTAAISIATNSHTDYGPGMRGWAEYSGVSFTQDMTGQFFGTFLIPSVTHTDPHYHRRPDMTIGHRIWHCVYQTFWQRADNRKETLNYSEILTPAIGIALSNLYVPGLQTHFSADAERYGVDLATAPIDNFITEFVPGIAAHIHTHDVFLERIINRVAVSGPGT
jgi:hypothetical protein